MDSNSQDSPVDIDDIQPIIDTPSSDTSISTSPQQSPTTTPCLTPKFPEDTDGDHLPATPPTPDPWMWKCHKCLKKYKFEATTRCLDDGHYFCQTPNSKRNRLRDDMKQKDYRICKSIFDSTGWEKFKAWQKKVRLAHGKEGEWESGCMNDCKRPYYCSSVLATPPATFGQGWLSATAVIDKAIDKAASSEDQFDSEEVRAGSKRARSKKEDIPPEAPPAKRRILTFELLDKHKQKQFYNRPPLICSRLRLVHCYQTTFLDAIDCAWYSDSQGKADTTSRRA
ncbi:hypothetical protein I7I50_06340 [Histoplasma capsulatum G186AR]|uniref:Uncharacterized protein n=1 Tax=Ajellomyces capsulatus TaxID=5037 RepID=A0A8H7Z2K7_AJECA|nr:hypothetical protein I7I52_10587 [Histoplasma capsulatum]QSS67311.1 hypothetical protein I7I50_06340 [Histoplasma capsulatum G186AR]